MEVIPYLVWTQIVLIPILGAMLLGIKRENDKMRRMIVWATQSRRSRR